MLPAETVAALRDHRRRQLEERLAAGGDYDDQRLVFCDPRGQPLSPSTVSRRFERLGREAGLPRLTLHGLRHTFATLALRAGVPSKVVAEVLGHVSHAHDRRHLHACHARDAGRRHRARRRTLAPLGGANRAALSVVNEGAELRDPVRKGSSRFCIEIRRRSRCRSRRPSPLWRRHRVPGGHHDLRGIDQADGLVNPWLHLCLKLTRGETGAEPGIWPLVRWTRVRHACPLVRVCECLWAHGPYGRWLQDCGYCPSERPACGPHSARRARSGALVRS